MKIQLASSYFYRTNLKQNIKEANEPEKPQSPKNNPQYTSNPYNLTFEARVDKSLQRFYETNAEVMPKTVKKYIEKLPDKNAQTPLEAQKNAFALLTNATSVVAVKQMFPEDKELFENLKEVSETKAPTGILGTYRINRELLEMCDTGILSSNENLTVWILKKMLLDGKTLSEINQDFEKEVNPEFISLHKVKNEDRGLILPSTLNALGIKAPAHSYTQSLRYTRDGYSDLVGKNISEAQAEFWASLSPEQRTQKSKIRVQGFERWWNTLSHNQKLDMIAEQMNELDLLNKYERFQDGNKKRKVGVSNTVKRQSQVSHNTTEPKVSSALSNDELFKIWAGNNLKVFNANLSEEDKKIIAVKRAQSRAEHIAQMSPEEFTGYISELKSRAEQLSMAMIDAWNNNKDIIIELSLFLRDNKVQSPQTALFDKSQLNEEMSFLMTNFWNLHPEFRTQLGDSIKASHQRIKDAVSNGEYSKLRADILNNKALREEDIKDAIKNLQNYSEISDTEYPKYMRDFISAIQSKTYMKLLPQEYYDTFFNIMNNDKRFESKIEAWTEAIKNGICEPEEILVSINNPKITSINRVLEASIATALFWYTNEPGVFTLDLRDSINALNQVYEGNDAIEFNTSWLKGYIPVNNKQKINVADIKNSYKIYNTPISSEKLCAIANDYFIVNSGNDESRKLFRKLLDYIDTYGHSILIAFSPTSKFPLEAKKEFLDKFYQKMPNEVKDCPYFDKILMTKTDLEKEEWIGRINNAIQKKYHFLPEEVSKAYCESLNKSLRDADYKARKTIEEFMYTDTTKLVPNTALSSVNVSREFSTYENIFQFLAAEQALADILYECSGNESVYALPLESLMGIFEFAKTIRKYPAFFDVMLVEEGKDIRLGLKKSININHIKSYYEDYMNEIRDYLNELNGNLEKSWNDTYVDPEEILFCLNPDESKTKIDEYTKERIKRYNFYNN